MQNILLAGCAIRRELADTVAAHGGDAVCAVEDRSRPSAATIDQGRRGWVAVCWCSGGLDDDAETVQLLAMAVTEAVSSSPPQSPLFDITIIQFPYVDDDCLTLMSG